MSELILKINLMVRRKGSYSGKWIKTQGNTASLCLYSVQRNTGVRGIRKELLTAFFFKHGTYTYLISLPKSLLKILLDTTERELGHKLDKYVPKSFKARIIVPNKFLPTAPPQVQAHIAKQRRKGYVF